MKTLVKVVFYAQVLVSVFLLGQKVGKELIEAKWWASNYSTKNRRSAYFDKLNKGVA